MKRNFSVAVLLPIILFGFLTCNLETEQGFYFDEETFTSEWNKWQDQNIKNYSFTLAGELPAENFSRAILMKKYSVNIIVKNGAMDSFEYTGDIPHDEIKNSVLEPEYTSISDIYQKISDRAREEREWWKGSAGEEIISTKLVVKYDAQLHYIAFYEPVSEWKSGLIVDTTDHAVAVSEFRILDEK